MLKAFRAGESQEAIEHHVAKAAAETLRRTHGVPELPALGTQMYLDAATGYGADGSSRRAMPAHIPTRLARHAYVQEWSSHEDAVRSHGLARRDSRTVA